MIYKSEIERIWKAQFDSLSRKDEPQLSDDEDKKDAKKPQMQPSVPSGPAGRSSPAPPFSRGSSLEREGSVGLDGSKSVLRIKRLVSYSLYINLSPQRLCLAFQDRRCLADGNNSRSRRHQGVCPRSTSPGGRSHSCRFVGSHW